MVDAPERYLETFAKAGAAGLTVHVEATRHLHRTLQAIRALGKTVGVALNPATPVVGHRGDRRRRRRGPGHVGEPRLQLADLHSAQRRRKSRPSGRCSTARGSRARLQVDGGVDPATSAAWWRPAPTPSSSGASVFGTPDPAAAVRALRAAAEAAGDEPPTGRRRSESRSPVRVRYAETDQMGVVYYANYFVWFEIGRTDLLRTLGSTYRQLEAEGLTLPVIEAVLSSTPPPACMMTSWSS